MITTDVGNGVMPASSNALPGVYLFSNLPAANGYAGYYAYTTDQGPVFSDGTQWSAINILANTYLFINLPPADFYPNKIAITSDLGPVYSNGVAWTVIGQNPATNFFLAGLYTFATLPSAAANPFLIAFTTDQGPAFSNGVAWELLYNPTVATLAISVGSPMPFATSGVAYSQPLTATQGTSPYTWSLVSQYGAANTVVITGSNLTIPSPVINGTTVAVVQVEDANGARQQITLAIPVSGAICATPTFSPAAGTYASTQSVTIACATAGAAIYYTTNGSVPTTASTLYTGAVSIAATSILQAIAVATGYNSSAVGSAAYTISSASTPAATPTFSPAAGTYTSAQTVTISCSTSSPTIHYTTDGTMPTTGSPVYSGPITVSASETVQAIATASGFTQSGLGSAAYTINIPLSPAATPTFSPAAGTYTSAQSVTIACSTPSSTIYYTTNGSSPTTGSTVYSGPITVAGSSTLKAIATASGFTQSAVGSAAYTISSTFGTLLPRVVNWNPTVMAQTVDVNQDPGTPGTSPTGEASEIQVLQASYVQYPALAGLGSYTVSGTKNSYGLQPGTAINPNTAIVGGYAIWRFWRTIETAQDNYSGAASIITTFQNLQYAIPGSVLGVGIACYSNWGTTFSGTAGNNGCIPSYIYNGSSATYGKAPPGANGGSAGWGLGNYNGSSNPTYQFVFAALWNANTMSRWNKCFIGVANFPVPNMTINGIAYNGYTIGTHPLIEMLNDFCPDDFGMTNNGSPQVPADYNTTTFQANWVARPAQLAAGLPNISMALMPGFGFTTGADQALKVQAMDAGRMAMSTTDTKAYNSVALPDLSDGLNAFLGNTYCTMTGGQKNITSNSTLGAFAIGSTIVFAGTVANLTQNVTYYVVASTATTFQVSASQGGAAITVSASGNTWTSSGGSVVHTGRMPSMPTLQPLDLSHNVAAYPPLGLPAYTADTQALVQLLIGFAYNTYKCDHFPISMASATTYNPAHDWAGSTGFIVPALLAMGGIPTANRALPLSYLDAPTTLVASSVGANSFYLIWNATAGAASYSIFLNGVVAVANLTQLGSLVSNLTPGTTYVVTVAKVNSNGTGPQSTSISVTTT